MFRFSLPVQQPWLRIQLLSFATPFSIKKPPFTVLDLRRHSRFVSLEYQDAFETIDKDGSGFITTRELKPLLRCLGCNPTDSELQEIVYRVDADGMLIM